MAIEIKVPSVGESISEVIIADWLKPAGSTVAKDEALVSLETDKVNVDVPSPAAGVLAKILKPKGASAKVGEVIALIEAAGAQPAATPAAPASTGSDLVPQGGAANGERFMMPAASRLAATSGVDTSAVTATGPGGRVLKEDVARALAAGGAATQMTATRPAAANDNASASLNEIVPLSPMRKRIAERLVQAQQTAALLTTFNEVDMTEVMAFRKAHNEAFSRKYGIKLGFMSFFVKAAVDALRAFPEINAEISGSDIVYHHYYDIGVAVGGEKGLVVPVVRRAETLSFAEIEQTISDFGKRAVAGKIKLEEMQGGTFTITNGGIFGSLMSTPIINPPQSGILGMHNIVERPIGLNGQIVLRPMMYIALTYDHRIVDGRGAVSFLKRIKDCIENPSRMLVEI